MQVTLLLHQCFDNKHQKWRPACNNFALVIAKFSLWETYEKLA